jgi:hypothetical protein
MPDALKKMPTAPRKQGRSLVVSVPLAGCLLLLALLAAGYQSARRQAQEARATAAEEQRREVLYRNALAKVQSERDGANRRNRADQTYILWLEKRLARYDAATPASWRAMAERQARQEAGAASEAQWQQMLAKMKAHIGAQLYEQRRARTAEGAGQ